MKAVEFLERWPSIAQIPCVSDMLDQYDRKERALRTMRRTANDLLQTLDTPDGVGYARHLALHLQDLADAALGYCGCPDCAAAEDAADPSPLGAYPWAPPGAKP